MSKEHDIHCNLTLIIDDTRWNEHTLTDGENNFYVSLSDIDKIRAIIIENETKGFEN